MTDYVIVDCEFIKLTDRAVLINDGDNNIWIPLSQVRPKSQGELEYLDNGDNFSLNITEWIAKQTGLI